MQATHADLFSAGRQRDIFPSAAGEPRIDASLPWAPGEDVILRFIPGEHRIHTNVGRSCTTGSGGFAWGYSGSGPSELAINILNQFVPPGADGFAPVELHPAESPTGAPNVASKTARTLSPEFEEAFLQQRAVSLQQLRSPLPAGETRDLLAEYNTLRIPAEEIERWIVARQDRVRGA